jgi:hypothetical protein
MNYYMHLRLLIAERADEIRSVSVVASSGNWLSTKARHQSSPNCGLRRAS